MSGSRYAHYEFLKIDVRQNGVALLTMNRPEVLNACTPKGHSELGQIWLDLDQDEAVNVSIITGEGKGFCAGDDLRNSIIGDPEAIQRTMEHAAAIVNNMVAAKKPIVSAINGVAVGAGLAVALLADISLASDRAKLIDGHTKLGIVAGDHAALIWPLLCGMARAKYYLLLCDTIKGEEAAQIGLVSKCVPHDDLMTVAFDVANRLAKGSQFAIQGTKQVLNNWLRASGAIFDQSLALEMASLFMPDAREGTSAFRERREARFPSAGIGQKV